MATAPQPAERRLAASSLSYLLAALNAGAGAIHFAMVPSHAGAGLLDPLGFALSGWFQLAVAGLFLTRHATRRDLLALAALGNTAAVGLWIWSHTAGLPFGVHEGVAEDVGALDAIAVALEVGAVAVALVMWLAPRFHFPGLSSVVLAVAALGLATVGLVDVGDGTATDHTHGAEEPAENAGDDDHSSDETAAAVSAGHVSEMAEVDAKRCDWQFNPQSYWDEARRLGVDTYAGGTMATHDDPSASASLEAVVASSPLDGRGSEKLDRLVSLATQAVSEISATTLVAELAEATDDEYYAFLDWLELNQGGHTQGIGGTTAAPDDTQGHGGHLGPHPWKAMVDREACDRLAAELDTAREIALRYPTAQDAIDAGWVMVTSYLPGIASHYMNFAYVDGRFDLEEPEMLLYDGSDTDARVVGLSYYIVLEGDAEPTQGFTGESDHFHRHIGLCMRGALVVGDTTTTEEECAAVGGRKVENASGWMNHVWVVPGCESPWGMFSAASPILDGRIGAESGDNDGGCSATAVRDRYDLSPGAAPEPPDEAVEGSAAAP